MKHPLIAGLMLALILPAQGCLQEDDGLFAIEVTGYRQIGRIEVTSRQPIDGMVPVTVVGHSGTVSSDGKIVAKNNATGDEETVSIHPLGSFAAEINASAGDTITLTYENGNKKEAQEITVVELVEPLPLANNGIYVGLPDDRGRVQVELALDEGLGDAEAVVVNPANGNVAVMTRAVGSILVAQVEAEEDDTLLVYFILDDVSQAYEARSGDEVESPLAIEVTGYKEVDLIGITATQQVKPAQDVEVRITGAAGSVAGYGRMTAINTRTQELTQADITPDGAFSIPVQARVNDGIELVYENNYVEESLEIQVKELPPFYEVLPEQAQSEFIPDFGLARISIHYNPDFNAEIPFSLVYLSNPRTGEVRRMEHFFEGEMGIIVGSIYADPDDVVWAYRLDQHGPDDPNGEGGLSLASLAMAIEVTGF
jgi:hypothetical protein